MMVSLSSIRRHADGSIDTSFYAAIGNRERSKAFRALWAGLVGRPRRMLRPVDAVRPHKQRAVAGR